jgi:hypothetical protein
MTNIGARALIPNPALAPLAFLIGEWRTTGLSEAMTVRARWR